MSIEKLDVVGEQYAWLNKVLSGTDFFSNLTMGQLEEILRSISLYAYPRGSTVFKQAGKAEAMFVVYEGRIGVYKKNSFFSLSKEIAQLGPGQILGEMALLDSAPRSATATTLEDSKLFALLAVDFQFLLEKNPDLERRMRHLAAQRRFNSTQHQ